MRTHGRVTPVSLDGVVAGAGALVGLVSEPSELMLGAGFCLQGALDYAFADGDEASEKILAALDAAPLMGRGA